MIPSTFAACLASQPKPHIHKSVFQPCCPSTFSAPVRTSTTFPQSPPITRPTLAHAHDHDHHSYRHTALSHAKASKPSAATACQLDKSCASTANATLHGCCPGLEDFNAIKPKTRTLLSAPNWRSSMGLRSRRTNALESLSSVPGSWSSPCCLP
jgi:hypothetical protein